MFEFIDGYEVRVGPIVVKVEHAALVTHTDPNEPYRMMLQRAVFKDVLIGYVTPLEYREG